MGPWPVQSTRGRAANPLCPTRADRQARKTGVPYSCSPSRRAQGPPPRDPCRLRCACALELGWRPACSAASAPRLYHDISGGRGGGPSRRPLRAPTKSPFPEGVRKGGYAKYANYEKSAGQIGTRFMLMREWTSADSKDETTRTTVTPHIRLPIQASLGIGRDCSRTMKTMWPCSCRDIYVCAYTVLWHGAHVQALRAACPWRSGPSQ